MKSIDAARVSRRETKRRRHLFTTAALFAVSGAMLTIAGGVRALRRWERSELAEEELSHLPESMHLRIERPDGAELAVFVSEPARETGDEGEPGELFVLAHGWTNDSRVWGPVARRLVERGHRVVAYDHRGHGSSVPGKSGFDLETLAEDLWAVLDHLDARDAVVAGHSMGGMTAQALAAMYPERVRERVGHMVLVATACEKIGRPRMAARFVPNLVAHPRLERAMRVPGVGAFMVRRVVGKEACRAHLDLICEMFTATSRDARAGFIESLWAMDLSASLPGLGVSVTVVAGERDNLLPRFHSRRIASLVPEARLVEIPHAGHMLPIEVPTQLAELMIGSSKRLTRPARPRPHHEVAATGLLGHRVQNPGGSAQVGPEGPDRNRNDGASRESADV